MISHYCVYCNKTITYDRSSGGDSKYVVSSCARCQPSRLAPGGVFFLYAEVATTHQRRETLSERTWQELKKQIGR